MADTTLRIWISGLCLLVRETAKRKAHVITPTTGMKGMMNGKPHVHQHTAQWLVDLGYFGGGQTTDFYVRVPFDGFVMDLSNIQSTAPPADPGNYVPNVTDILKLDVIRTALEGKLPPEASSRLTLAHGTATDRLRGGCYDFEAKQNIEMPPAVEWTIEKISWPPRGISDETGLLSRLTPINDQVILYLFNAPAEELPVKPNNPPTSSDKPNRPPHYIAYYNLFDVSNETRVPKFRSTGPCDGTDRPLSLRGVNPFTCMLAGGDA
jgi:hypothetical protein